MEVIGTSFDHVQNKFEHYNKYGSPDVQACKD